ncbi:MAG: hypothetical protein R3E87_20130 [Burkholderiaceae bacterium]
MRVTGKEQGARVVDVPARDCPLRNIERSAIFALFFAGYASRPSCACSNRNLAQSLTSPPISRPARGRTLLVSYLPAIS